MANAFEIPSHYTETFGLRHNGEAIWRLQPGETLYKVNMLS
jgi:hypothetical protein